MKALPWKALLRPAHLPLLLAAGAWGAFGLAALVAPAPPRGQPLWPMALVTLTASLLLMRAGDEGRGRLAHGAATGLLLLATLAAFLLYTLGLAPVPEEPGTAVATHRLHHRLQATALLLVGVAAALLTVGAAPRRPWRDPVALAGLAGAAALLLHAAVLGLLVPQALFSGPALPTAQDEAALALLQRTAGLGPLLVGAALLGRAILEARATERPAAAHARPPAAPQAAAPGASTQATRCPGCGKEFTIQRLRDRPTPVACPQCGKRGMLPAPAARPPEG